MDGCPTRSADIEHVIRLDFLQSSDTWDRDAAKTWDELESRALRSVANTEDYRRTMTIVV